MALTEKRTQIYLTLSQHSALVRAARTRNVSLAEVVREAVNAYLTRKPGPEPGGSDPLADLIGCFEGPGDLSDRHDDYLYGGPEAVKTKASRPRRKRPRGKAIARRQKAP